MCVGLCVPLDACKIRGIGFLLPLKVSQGLNSGHEVWQQTSLPTGLTQRPQSQFWR